MALHFHATESGRGHADYGQRLFIHRSTRPSTAGSAPNRLRQKS